MKSPLFSNEGSSKATGDFCLPGETGVARLERFPLLLLFSLVGAIGRLDGPAAISRVPCPPSSRCLRLASTSSLYEKLLHFRRRASPSRKTLMRPLQRENSHSPTW